jgi:hypothetical protein
MASDFVNFHMNNMRRGAQGSEIRSPHSSGMDLKAIRRDQAAIDKLPNRGRASVNHGGNSARNKAIHAKMGKKGKKGKN